MLTDFQRFIIEARIAIWSMSFELKLAIRKMEDLQDTVTDHLTYVVAFPDAQEQKHWRKELWTFF